MIGYRIKYKNIVSELYVPKKSNGNTIIFLAGLPSPPGKNELIKNLVSEGFTVFQPYYSGSFDSDGVFDPEQCVMDVKIFIEMAKLKQHQELYFDKILKIKTKRVILMGSSFGSSITALSVNLPAIDKFVFLLPVLTYSNSKIRSLNLKIKDIDLGPLLLLLRRGYKHSYRIKNFSKWRKFFSGKVKKLEPIDSIKEFLRKPALFVQAGEDYLFTPNFTKKFLQKYLDGASYKFYVVRGAGHSTSDLVTKQTMETLISFLYDK